MKDIAYTSILTGVMKTIRDSVSGFKSSSGMRAPVTMGMGAGLRSVSNSLSRQKADYYQKLFKSYYCGDLGKAIKADIERRKDIHIALDIFGYVPGFGSFSDALNAVFYLGEENYKDAALSGIGVIPFIKIISGVAKINGNTVKLAENASNIIKRNKTVEDILRESEFVKASKSIQYRKSGTYEDAFADFNALGLKDIKQYEDKKWVGYLNDGRTVIVRKESKQGAPTLEIQGGEKTTKIRYEKND